MRNREEKKITVRPNGKLRVQVMPVGESLTQQQFKEDCDVNVIMARYMKTGQINHLKASSGVYADMTQLGDYHEAMQTVKAAEDSFMTLPAEVRFKFDNDPQKLINYLEDEKNYEDSIKMGLRVKPEQPRPNPVEVGIEDLKKEIAELKKVRKKPTSEA